MLNLRRSLIRVAARIQALNVIVCIVFLCVLFCAQISIVLMRYMMGIGFLEIQDAVTYAFACLVTLSIPLALGAERHVRVDIFRSRLTDSTNRLIDRFGHLLLTFPVFALLLFNAYPLVRDSWALLEGSRETGGLPGLFLVRSTIVLMALLILLQALVQMVATKDEEPWP